MGCALASATAADLPELAAIVRDIEDDGDTVLVVTRPPVGALRRALGTAVVAVRSEAGAPQLAEAYRSLPGRCVLVALPADTGFELAVAPAWTTPPPRPPVPEPLAVPRERHPIHVVFDPRAATNASVGYAVGAAVGATAGMGVVVAIGPDNGGPLIIPVVAGAFLGGVGATLGTALAPRPRRWATLATLASGLVMTPVVSGTAWLAGANPAGLVLLSGELPVVPLVASVTRGSVDLRPRPQRGPT
ncbi:MAG: hypothetical protein H6735_06235 [Alphaproteobacteria bacterium]|nr:hypothetical protein [Alphaproteobacteria bacterium]